MEQRDMVLKVKKKLTILLLICLAIAFAFIVPTVLKMLSDKREMSGGGENGEARIEIEMDTPPFAMTPVSDSGSWYYYVKDVTGQTYIAKLSDETFHGIVDTYDQETSKLSSVYRLEGTKEQIDEQIKELALENGFKVFGSDRLNADNFEEYLGEFYIEEHFVSYTTATLYKAFVLCGVFFLVLAFGYVMPILIRISKGNFGILDENHMRTAMEKYIPRGEALTAGIHAVGIQTEIKQVFGKCICDGDQLIPSEDGAALEVKKSKFSNYDVYVGITQHYLILAECGEYKHLYEFNDTPDVNKTAVSDLDVCIPLKEIGTCFPLAEIQSYTVKKAWMGSVNCTVAMKNGSLLKLMLPKGGGPGMPRHAEYRDALIARLSVERA